MLVEDVFLYEVSSLLLEFFKQKINLKDIYKDRLLKNFLQLEVLKLVLDIVIENSIGLNFNVLEVEVENSCFYRDVCLQMLLYLMMNICYKVIGKVDDIFFDEIDLYNLLLEKWNILDLLFNIKLFNLIILKNVFYK